jgi:hypothetical protein
VLANSLANSDVAQFTLGESGETASETRRIMPT